MLEKDIIEKINIKKIPFTCVTVIEEDNKLKERIEAKGGLENYLYNLKNTFTTKDDSPAILSELKTEIDPIIEGGLKWLENNDKEETSVYKEKQKELEGKVNPLMEKLYSQNLPPGAEVNMGPSDEIKVNKVDPSKQSKEDELD